MSSPSEKENLEFWQRRALEALPSRLAKSGKVTTERELTDEADELLWAFAEGQLSESATEQLGQLVSQIPQAMRRLEEIHQAIEETANAKPGNPAKAWARLSAHQPLVAKKSPIEIFDMVLRFVQDGLELLATTGQTAYVPALARSNEDTPQTTAALEFLTSIGTVQIVVDQVADEQCNLMARPTRLIGRLETDELTLDVRDASGVLLRSEPFEGGRARVFNLVCGTYRFVLVKGEDDLATITCDLQRDV